MKALLDFIPLIAFFIAARYSGILAAAGALLVATLIVYAIHFIRQKGKFDKQQWVVLLLTILFCGGTLLLRDDIYLRWKSPIINGVFALTLLISAAINKPFVQRYCQPTTCCCKKGQSHPKTTHRYAAQTETNRCP